MSLRIPTPEDIEIHRDYYWRRECERRIETSQEAEKYVDEVGFLFALTDIRRPGPSLYTAICGRRDAHLPRNVQKDPESSLTWRVKDEVMSRGRIYYAKVVSGLATFIAPRLVPYFYSVFGVSRGAEAATLSPDARLVLRILRKEWELASSDLRVAAKFPDRKRLTKALDELQKRMKVVPSDVLYEPMFTYIWSVPEARFQSEFSKRVDRDIALREIARAFLNGAGMTFKGELAKVLGISRPEAGRANLSLVDEGYAELLDPGVYVRRDLL
ncbi:MAG: hypothetical protein QOH96_3011, partial [Blastocatellia bacterium]|nr:hypothetical protein [Blastocatellia bacterium]